VPLCIAGAVLGAVRDSSRQQNIKPSGRRLATDPGADALASHANHPSNVAALKVAWTYHMKPPAPAGGAPPEAVAGRGGRGRGGGGFSASQVTPLVVNGTMYIATPYFRVVAVDPTTGKEVWAYQLPSGNASTRGVEYWPGDSQTPRRLSSDQVTAAYR
jgi:outer membrane protein assembly factor BamB